MSNGEQIFYEFRPAWRSFWPHFLSIGILFGILNKVGNLLIIFFFFLVSLSLILISRYRYLYLISNKRVVSRAGLLVSYLVEIDLKDINVITIKQTLFGRILNYGDIMVVSGADSDKTIAVNFKNIASPHEIKELIKRLKNQNV